MNKAYLKNIEIFIPNEIVSNEDIINRLNGHGKLLRAVSFDRLFGIHERRYAASDQQVSDLAVKAGQKILSLEEKANFDLLIFAAASSDFIEPATANVVQDKLGIDCAAMDIKNACNSVISAIEVAKSFIESGSYENILITCGEKLSNAVKFELDDSTDFNKRLASYSLGDAACAIHIAQSNNERGIYYHKSKTVGKYWDLCTIEGGGSMYPRNPKKMYFSGKTKALKNAFLSVGTPFIKNCLNEMNATLDDFDWIATHQVSEESINVISDALNFEKGRILNIVGRFGNTASASIPLALKISEDEGFLRKNDRVLILGLAAGLNISCTAMVY